jgi:hypothetical protein
MKSKLFISFLTVITFVVSIYLYVTGSGITYSAYGPGEVILFAIPFTMMLVAIQHFTMPVLLKQGDFFSRFKKGMDHIFVSLTLILLILHIGLLLLASGAEFDLLRLLPILVGTVLITTGNTLPRFQFHTIDQLSSHQHSTQQIWNITLRPFAYPLFWGGIIMLLCVFLQETFMLVSFFAVLVITLLTAVSRAYKAYQLHFSER